MNHNPDLYSLSVEVPANFREQRPYIYVNMASSIDGKITTANRESFVLGTEADWHRMDILRSKADAILNGARTIRDDNPPVRVRDASLRELRRELGKPPQPANVIISQAANFPTDARLYQEDGARVILAFPEAATERLEQLDFPDSVEFLPLSGEVVELSELLRQLKEMGIELLLAEGGGALNASLAEGDFIDEFFLTMTPWIVGGSDAPTPVEGAGLDRASLLRYALVSCHPVADEVFLRYRRR